ncbi:MAG: DMT family transporter [Bacteroidota bacterium]
MNINWIGHAALFFAQVIYALNYSIAKGLMPEAMHPFTLVLFRIAGAGCLFWISSFFLPKEKVSYNDLKQLFKLCFFGVVLNQFFFITGLCYTSPINSAIIMICSPILVFALGVLLHRDPIRWNIIVGLGIALCGALCMLLFKGHFQWGSDTFKGDLMTVINATSWAIFLIYSKPILTRYHTVTTMKWLFLFGFSLALPIGLPFAWTTQFASFTWYTWMALAFVVVATTFLAYLLNIIGLKRLNAVTTGAYIYLQPFLASVVAYILNKDELTLTKILSGICIISGLSLIHFNTFKKSKT